MIVNYFECSQYFYCGFLVRWCVGYVDIYLVDLFFFIFVEKDQKQFYLFKTDKSVYLQFSFRIVLIFIFFVLTEEV